MSLSKDFSVKSPLHKVTFEISAEKVNGVSAVALLGDFNEWNSLSHPLKKQKNGNFKTTIELEGGRSYEFRYLLDGQYWLNDEQGDAYVWSRVSADENFVVELPSIDVTIEKTTAKAPKVVAPKAVATKAPVAKKEVAPKVTKTEKAPKADDLTLIEGIGPKAAKVLIAAGISTFIGLAKAKAADVKTILVAADAKVGHLDPTTWAKQAKLAADGKFDALETLKKELNNGKVVK